MTKQLVQINSLFVRGSRARDRAPAFSYMLGWVENAGEFLKNEPQGRFGSSISRVSTQPNQNPRNQNLLIDNFSGEV